MSHVADSRTPNGLGILPLRHDNFIGAGFSVDFRGSLVAQAVLDRDEFGSWIYDPESVGTLEGGNLWKTDLNARRVPGWAFAWPAVVSAMGGKADVATPGGGGGATVNAPKNASIAVFPLGGGAAPDNRYLPKQPVMPFKDGKPSQDPQAVAAAAAAAAAAAGGNGNVMYVGIGAQVVPFSGGGFPQFIGVNTNFSGGGFPTFSGVNTNFSNGGPQAGATFTPPKPFTPQVNPPKPFGWPPKKK